MRVSGGIASFVGGVLGFLVVGLFFYLIYVTIASSWGLLLSAAGVALVGLILLGIGLGFEENLARRMKRGEVSVPSRLTSAIISQAGSGLATASFAVAVGLVLTAIFQGAVLSGDPDVFAHGNLSAIEESLLEGKLWLDRALGLDVLAAILVVAIALSLLVPVRSIVRRTLSVRSAVSFVYLVLVTITSFTFFAGFALKPYELALRDQLRVRAGFAFDQHWLDARKHLVAIAWIIEKLEDPSGTPIPPDLAQRLAEYFQRSPYNGEIETAAWRIAGYDTVLYFIEDGTHRKERQARELEVLAEDMMPAESAPTPGLVHAIAKSLFGDTFAWLKSERRTGALEYAGVLRAVDPSGQGWSGASNAPLTQARIAAMEILSSLVAEKIGGGVTSEIVRHFVGELVQAVVIPLWDVALPLDVRDVETARAFVAAQKLDRAPLKWGKLSELPPLPAETLQVEASSAPSTGGGIGSSSPQAMPLSTLPSWQSYSGTTGFVFHVSPSVTTPETYTRPTIRIR